MKVAILTLIILIFSPLCIYQGFLNNKDPQIDQNKETLKVIRSKKADIQEKSNIFEANMELAELYFNVGEHKNAEAYYKKAILADNKNQNGYLKLGNLYRFQGNFTESERVYNKALEMDPDSSLIYDELGKLYRNWGKHELAKKMFEKAIDINPKDDSAYGYGLGYLYRDMGDLNLAEENFKKAFSLNPNAFNYRALGDLYREQKKYSESEKMFKKALEVDPTEKDNEGLAWLYFEQKKYDKAESEFKKYLIDVRPKGEVYYGLGRSLFSQGKIKEAETASINSIKLNAKTVHFYDLLIQIYEKEGKIKEAWATYVRKGFVERNYM